MMHLISTRRLEALEATIASLRTEVQQVRAAAHSLVTAQRLAEQARDFYQREAGKWEARASRFIDQIGVSSATLSSSAMTEAPGGSADGPRRVMAALGRSEKRTPPQTPSGTPVPTSSAQILGVSETAAAAAVSHVLNP